MRYRILFDAVSYNIYHFVHSFLENCNHGALIGDLYDVFIVFLNEPSGLTPIQIKLAVLIRYPYSNKRLNSGSGSKQLILIRLV